MEKFSRLKQVGYLGIYAEIIQYIMSRFSKLLSDLDMTYESGIHGPKSVGSGPSQVND
jgi:hypothetical protein